MKKVVGISLGSGEQNFEFETSFMGQPFHVRRIGTGGNIAVTWGQVLHLYSTSSVSRVLQTTGARPDP